MIHLVKKKQNGFTMFSFFLIQHGNSFLTSSLQIGPGNVMKNLKGNIFNIVKGNGKGVCTSIFFTFPGLDWTRW